MSLTSYGLSLYKRLYQEPERLLLYCDICHHIWYFSQYWTAVMASSGFYFEKRRKKTHMGLLWQSRQSTWIFGSVLQVNWPDVAACRQHFTDRHRVDWSETYPLVADRTQTKRGSGGINPAHQFGYILGFKAREEWAKGCYWPEGIFFSPSVVSFKRFLKAWGAETFQYFDTPERNERRKKTFFCKWFFLSFVRWLFKHYLRTVSGLQDCQLRTQLSQLCKWVRKYCW